MATIRRETVEQLRGHSSGKFFKLIGLDQVPEVLCFREKLDQLSIDDANKQWSTHLNKYWIQAAPDTDGTLVMHTFIFTIWLDKIKIWSENLNYCEDSQYVNIYF